MTDLADELARHHEAACGWALACCRWDCSAAEDVLQTAYVRILDGRASFANRSTFRTFLFGVIWRTASEERRRRAVRSALSLAWLRQNGREPSIPPVGLGRLMQDESWRAIVSALGQLSARQREVLHLVFYQDLTIAEAAEVMGIAIGSARSHYERGKANLRQLLGHNGNETTD